MIRALITLAALGLAFLSPPPAQAQQANLYCYSTVAPNWQPCSAANQLQIGGSFSAAGFPTVQTTGTPISVTSGGVTGTLPTGTVVVATNVGSTNAAYCKLGASATTSDQYIAPSGGWFAFTVGANTQLTCITSTSTTTVNMVGGSGLATGTGGGSGGGGGGLSVTDQAAWTQASSAFTPGGGVFNDAATLSSGQQGTFRMTTKRAQIVDVDSSGNQLHTDLTAPIAACGASPCTTIIGTVSNDPCATQLKTNFAIATSSGNVQIVGGVSAKKVYLCSLSLIAAATAVVNIIEGTGAACTTANEAAVIGSTTAASGMSLAANGGLTLGNGGGTVGVTGTAANGLCLLQSGTTALAGNATYVQQ
jgi:hypothetical protein